eukprot:6190433-Pleurochrysis_carterae.AAC.2
MECCSTSTRPPHGLSLLRAAAAMASVVQSRCVFDVLALRSLSISYIFVGAACSRERKVMGTCAYGENALRACCKPFALDAVQEMLCASGTELLFMLYEDMFSGRPLRTVYRYSCVITALSMSKVGLSNFATLSSVALQRFLQRLASRFPSPGMRFVSRNDACLHVQ